MQSQSVSSLVGLICELLFQRYFLVGSNNSQTKFRVLKIDRMEPRELNVVDDQREYSREEIQDLLSMIDVGNRNRQGISGTPFLPVASAFGIVGKFFCLK